MQFTIKCKSWNESERREKNNELCETVGMLQDRAMGKYGEPSVSRLRLDFLNGLYTFGKDKIGRAAMEKLLFLEGEFLSAYSRQVCGIARSFWRVNHRNYPTLEVDDYIQEGCIALTNSVYHYDGSAAFTSYLQNVVRRSLSSFLRDNEVMGGVGRNIKKWRKMVVRSMKQEHIDVYQAIENLRKTEKITESEVKKLVDSIYIVAPLDVDEIGVRHRKNKDDGLDRELINLCLEEANLTPMERELVDAYMVGDSRTKIAENRINPNTGNLYTTQALSLYFKSACEKIKVALSQRKFAA